MAYNERERSSLMNLLAALRGGLAGDQGLAILNDIMQQQQARVDVNRQRRLSLTDMLTSRAEAGATLDAAKALAQAYTPQGGISPAMREVVQDLYPMQEVPGPMTGVTPPPYMQGRGGPEQIPMPGEPRMERAETSPLYQEPEVDPNEQRLQELQLEAAEREASMAETQQGAVSAITQFFMNQIGTTVTPTDPSGQPVMEEGEEVKIKVTPENLMDLVMNSTHFQGLNPETQMAVLAAIDQQLSASATSRAVSRPAAAQPKVAGAGPSGMSLLHEPGGWSILPNQGIPFSGLDASNTRWQDLFGFFPGLFG